MSTGSYYDLYILWGEVEVVDYKFLVREVKTVRVDHLHDVCEVLGGHRTDKYWQVLWLVMVGLQHAINNALVNIYYYR